MVFGRKSHLQNVVVVVKIDDDDFRRKKVFEDFLDDDDERRRGSLSAVVVTIVVVVVANDARGDDKSLVLESAERAKRFDKSNNKTRPFSHLRLGFSYLGFHLKKKERRRRSMCNVMNIFTKD